MKKRKISALRKLGSRLDVYRASVRMRQSAVRSAKTDHWQKYAAVAGSALAMASSASANTIVYSGAISNVFASTGAGHQTAPFTLDGRAFSLRLSRGSGSRRQTGAAVLAHPLSAGVFWHEAFFTPEASHMYGTSSGVRRLLSGAAISSRAGAADGQGRDVWDPTLFASWSIAGRAGFHFSGGAGTKRVGTWQPGQTGYAGVELNSDGEVFYGWLKLEYFQSDNGLPQRIELLAEAYNEVAGSGLLAGETENQATTSISIVPEPATSALALLAAGSAGVLAWRRRHVG